VATTCIILLAEERDPRIRVTESAYDAGELSLCLGADRVILTEHQAYEIEAVLARHRQRRRQSALAAVLDPPVPAEACSGCTVDADDRMESMASNRPGEVP
jgi:hypothetical protein